LEETTRTSYFQLRGFEHLYLEDSFVLEVLRHSDRLTLKLEVVLQVSHKLYEKPKAGEQYCYRKADLVFPNLTEISWLRIGDQRFADASGSSDYGNIDEFFFANGIYHLDGDWGACELKSDPPRLDYT
jgi:hypothetical protein